MHGDRRTGMATKANFIKVFILIILKIKKGATSNYFNIENIAP